ncbi:hypothetical protein K443DRAFT_126595, partial [Laccaria amethystina LaAM-08-1]
MTMTLLLRRPITFSIPKIVTTTITRSPSNSRWENSYTFLAEEEGRGLLENLAWFEKKQGGSLGKNQMTGDRRDGDNDKRKKNALESLPAHDGSGALPSPDVFYTSPNPIIHSGRRWWMLVGKRGEVDEDKRMARLARDLTISKLYPFSSNPTSRPTLHLKFMLPFYSLVLPAAVELIATGPATMEPDLLPEELFNQSFISSLYEKVILRGSGCLETFLSEGLRWFNMDINHLVAESAFSINLAAPMEYHC